MKAMDMATELSSPNTDKKLPCDRRTHVANKITSLQGHKIAKHEGQIHGCDKCDFKTVHKNSLERHKLNHSIKHRKYNCKQTFRFFYPICCVDEVSIFPFVKETFWKIPNE